MGWREETMATCSLLVTKKPNGLLVRLAADAMRLGEAVEPPRVRGSEVVKGHAVVLAARELGLGEIPVLVCVAGEDGPAMGRVLPLTAEQRPLVELAIERVREIEPGLRDYGEGAAIECVCADFLADYGPPGLNLPPRQRTNGIGAVPPRAEARRNTDGTG